MQMEEATKESEIVKRKMQKALAKSMEYKRYIELLYIYLLNEQSLCKIVLMSSQICADMHFTTSEKKISKTVLSVPK